jgi:hypothetical protein
MANAAEELCAQRTMGNPPETVPILSCLLAVFEAPLRSREGLESNGRGSAAGKEKLQLCRGLDWKVWLQRLHAVCTDELSQPISADYACHCRPIREQFVSAPRLLAGASGSASSSGCSDCVEGMASGFSTFSGGERWLRT